MPVLFSHPQHRDYTQVLTQTVISFYVVCGEERGLSMLNSVTHKLPFSMPCYGLTLIRYMIIPIIMLAVCNVTVSACLLFCDYLSYLGLCLSPNLDSITTFSQDKFVFKITKVCETEEPTMTTKFDFLFIHIGLSQHVFLCAQMLNWSWEIESIDLTPCLTLWWRRGAVHLPDC